MSSDPWTVARVLGFATDDFKKRNLPSPRLDAELLLTNALGIDRVRLVIESERALNDTELKLYRSLIQRRRTGEPIVPNRHEVDAVRLLPGSRVQAELDADPGAFTPWFRLEWQRLSDDYPDVLDRYTAPAPG